MKNKMSKCFASIFFASLILAFVVQITQINMVEAQNGPPADGQPIDVPGGKPMDGPGGKNIVKNKPSSGDIPLHQAELKDINDQLIQNPSEAVRDELLVQKEQIIYDVEKWFEDNTDPVKEEEAREKQDLLTASIIEERNNSSIAEQMKSFPMTSVGYDYVSNALEVTIDPTMFSNVNIEKYIEKI